MTTGSTSLFEVSAHLESGGEGVKGSSEFLQLAQEPLLLEAVAQVLGSDFALWGCQIFCKPGGDGMEVPMHQDGEYWPIRPLKTVTVWLALDRQVAKKASRGLRSYEI